MAIRPIRFPALAMINPVAAAFAASMRKAAAGPKPISAPASNNGVGSPWPATPRPVGGAAADDAHSGLALPATVNFLPVSYNTEDPADPLELNAGEGINRLLSPLSRLEPAPSSFGEILGLSAFPSTEEPAYRPPPPSGSDHGRSEASIDQGDSLTKIAGKPVVVLPGEDAPTFSAKDITLLDQEDYAIALVPGGRDPDLTNIDERVVTLDRQRSNMVIGQDKQLEGLTKRDRRTLKDKKVDGGDLSDKGQALVSAVETEMHYAAQYAAVPAGGLNTLKTEFKDRYPDDAVWAAVVDRASAQAETMWNAQGRTAAVMEPLYGMANPTGGDNSRFSQHVKSVFAGGAATEPTVEAVERWRDMMLTYGPMGENSQQSIKDAAHAFLVTDPKAAAKKVEKAYDEGQRHDKEGLPVGAPVAAKKLAELTDPQKTDPLTAALIIEASQPTLDKIIDDLPDNDIHIVDYNRAIIGSIAGSGLFEKSEWRNLETLFDPFVNLTAIADTAARSPKGEETITVMAERLAAKGKSYNLQSGVASNSDSGATLSLAFAQALRMNGDKDAAAGMEKSVLDGIDALEDRARNVVNELGAAAAPMLYPPAQWDRFLPEDKVPDEDWFKDKAVRTDVKAKMSEIDAIGGRLTRTYSAVAKYLPRLSGSPHHKQLEEAAQPPDLQDPNDEPELSLVLTTSRVSKTEVLRNLNLEGIKNDVLEVPTIIPNWSWAAREARNFPDSIIEARGNNRPMSIGLRLYGAGTYGWGVGNKIEDERGSTFDDALAIGAYGAGVISESGLALGQALARRWEMDANPSNWKDLPGNRGRALGAVAKFNAWQLHAMNAWFGLGAVQAALDGDWFGAANLGGTLAGSVFAQADKLHARWGIGKWGRLAGNGVLLAGSILLALKDEYDAQEADEAFIEKYQNLQRQYLEAAGVKPEIAQALTVIDSVHESRDLETLSIADRLATLAKIRGDTSPQEIMDYLNDQADPERVAELARKLVAFKVSESGAYLDHRWAVGSSSWEVRVLIEWIDEHMDDFPGGHA